MKTRILFVLIAIGVCIPAYSNHVLPDEKPRATDEEELAKKVDALVKLLDDGDFKTRRKAYDELQKLGVGIASQLETILERSPSVEVKKRVEELLVGLEAQRKYYVMRSELAKKLTTAHETKDVKEFAATLDSILKYVAEKDRKRLKEIEAEFEKIYPQLRQDSNKYFELTNEEEKAKLKEVIKGAQDKLTPLNREVAEIYKRAFKAANIEVEAKTKTWGLTETVTYESHTQFAFKMPKKGQFHFLAKPDGFDLIVYADGDGIPSIWKNPSTLSNREILSVQGFKPSRPDSFDPKEATKIRPHSLSGTWAQPNRYDVELSLGSYLGSSPDEVATSFLFMNTERSDGSRLKDFRKEKLRGDLVKNYTVKSSR